MSPNPRWRRPDTNEPHVSLQTLLQERSSPVASTDGGRRVGAVLLAAGESERFGEGNKLLASVEGTPIVRHACSTLLEAGLDEVVVIVGYDEQGVHDALEGLPVDLHRNPDYADGQSTSVRVGVDAARERNWQAAIFALGDMPFVDPPSVSLLLGQYASDAGTIVAAGYEGKRGNPVLFDRSHYDTLADVTGDMGGRRLVETHDEAVIVETDDPGVTRDVDYAEDLAKYTE